MPMRPMNQPDRPSRYSTNTKPAYTRAEPVSLSATITSIGISTMSAAMMKCRILLILKPGRLIMDARRSDVVILDNSAGWNLTGPSSNQECEPFTLWLMKITSTNSTSTTRYAGLLMLSQKYELITKSTKAASTMAPPIHSACLPLLQLRSNMEEGSPDCTAA